MVDRSRVSSAFIRSGRQGSEHSDARDIVDGRGAWLECKDGTKLLDASNTGGPLGHRHPAMAQAIREAADFPVLNESRQWGARDLAAEELIEVAFGGEDWIGGVCFGLSGGEVNDMALTLAQSMTGRAPLVARERAYHGLTGLSRDVTVQPQWHGGLSTVDGSVSPPAKNVPVRIVAGPNGGAWQREGFVPPRALEPDELRTAVDGAAAIVVDYTQGGRYYDPTYQDEVASAARDAGALWIADEVVTGLGRTGRWMSFHGADSRPDIVTLGKPLAGGAGPAGAVVLSKRVLEALEHTKWQNYSTFRAHPATIHAIRAHLRVVESEALVDRAKKSGAMLGAGLIELAHRHSSIVRVAGNGLHWTIELDGVDWRSWESTSVAPQLSDLVVAEARSRGVLVSTSDEPSSLFLAPPLVVKEEEIEMLLEVLDESFARSDAGVPR